MWTQSQLSSISVQFLFQSATWTLLVDICRQMPPLSQCRESHSLHVLILRVVKGFFVIRERPFLFPVNCEMANFFLVKRDLVTEP